MQPAVKEITGPPQRTRLLSSSLGTRNNALDLIRLVAACLVILGHSFAIVGRGSDPMARWNGVEFSGGFALHIFFFLSGLLVTYSFLNKPDIVHWLGARVLRIFPALFCCLVLTALIYARSPPRFPFANISAHTKPGITFSTTCSCVPPATICPAFSPTTSPPR